MTKSEIQSSWKKVIKEVSKVPDWDKLEKSQKQYQRVIICRELLLFCQVLLRKIEVGENKDFNSMIFKKTMNFYCDQIKRYV